MTWHTEVGDRSLKGAEAELIRLSLGILTDQVRCEIECRHIDSDDTWMVGIPLYDALQPTQKLATLARVGRFLLRDTQQCAPLTALNEACVAALYQNVRDLLLDEIETSRAIERSFSWRQSVLAAYIECCPESDAPSIDCDDVEEWDLLMEVLAARVLWDDDFNDADLFLDASPEDSKTLKERLGNSQGLLAAILWRYNTVSSQRSSHDRNSKAPQPLRGLLQLASMPLAPGSALSRCRGPVREQAA
jgi:hypothetical protein